MPVENASTKSTRIETRVTLEQKRLIELAASYQGRSVSEFVIGNAEAAAKQVIQEYERLHLNREQSRVLVEALLSPKRPNKSLHDAARRHKTQVTSR
jgi:uncharacterized protein (DUF1778 family)